MSIKKKELKNMNEAELEKKLNELEMEKLTGEQSTKVKSLKLSIARIKTFLSQLKKPVVQQAKTSGKHPIVSHPKMVSEKPLNTGKAKTVQVK